MTITVFDSDNIRLDQNNIKIYSEEEYDFKQEFVEEGAK